MLIFFESPADVTSQFEMGGRQKCVGFSIRLCFTIYSLLLSLVLVFFLFVLVGSRYSLCRHNSPHFTWFIFFFDVTVKALSSGFNNSKKILTSWAFFSLKLPQQQLGIRRPQHSRYHNIDTVLLFRTNKNTTEISNKQFFSPQISISICAGPEQKRTHFHSHSLRLCSNIINNNLRKSLQSSSVVDYVNIGETSGAGKLLVKRSRLHFECALEFGFHFGV